MSLGFPFVRRRLHRSWKSQIFFSYTLERETLLMFGVNERTTNEGQKQLSEVKKNKELKKIKSCETATNYYYYFFRPKRHFDPDIVYRLPTRALSAPFCHHPTTPLFVTSLCAHETNWGGGRGGGPIFFLNKTTLLRKVLVETTSVWIFILFYFWKVPSVSLCGGRDLPQIDF